ncbi:MAG: hypothetical protein V4553_04100 [Bacteroidota bacterium]
MAFKTNVLEETKDAFDKAEMELLKEGLKRSYKERFEFATSLYKAQLTMQKAVITHKPFIRK